MSVAPLTSSLSTNWQRWFLVAVLLLFVAASIQYTAKIAGHDSASAIQRWREQILSLDAGEDLYKHFNYPNPPIMALILRPIVALPGLAGPLVWFYLKVGMALLALHWTVRLVETPEQPFPPWAKTLAVLLTLRPVLGDLMHGNVNLLILLMVVAALYAYRCGRDRTCGLLLGLAIACKVTPALFVPYFVWKRQWKVVSASVVGLFLFFWLVPGMVLGFAENERLLASWTEQMVKPYVVGGKVFYSEHNNQSLPGLVSRLLTHRPSFSDYVNDHYHPLEYHNLVDLGDAASGRIVRGGMVLFALLGVWACRTPTVWRGGWRLPAEFSLVLLGMLLFSERTWKHHCVTLMLPFGVLCYYLAACRPGPLLRNYLMGTLSAAAVLMTTTATGPLGERFGKMAQVYGAYVWVYLLLTAALVVILVENPKSESRNPKQI